MANQTNLHETSGRPTTRGDGKTFTFKCHRNKVDGSSSNQEAHAINSIAFHPKVVTGKDTLPSPPPIFVVVLSVIWFEFFFFFLFWHGTSLLHFFFRR